MLTATIASGASLSSEVRVPGGKAVVAILMPATWTTANLTFSVSFDGATYQNLYDDLGSEVTVVAATGDRVIRLMPSEWWAAPFFKLRSGTSGTPVNQAGARTITLYWQ
jgi:hypothetical protein